MANKYTGSYFRGNNIGTRIIKQRNIKTKKHEGKKGSWTGYIIIGTALTVLIAFLYFNKKEDQKYKRDNIEDTVELIQKVAGYNLETDLAKSQSVQKTKNNSVKFRNPTQIRMIQQEKQKAMQTEIDRQKQYLAQQYALDDGISYEITNKNNEMNQTHQTFYKPEQPANNTQEIIPIDYNKQEQIDMMYNTQFSDNNNQKPHHTINSPFIHPQETTRPLAPQPAAFNNTLNTDNNVSAFMQNVPSNVFKQDFFKATDNYESPYLANIDKITKYGSPCSDKSNINKSGDPSIGAFNNSDFFYL